MQRRNTRPARFRPAALASCHAHHEDNIPSARHPGGLGVAQSNDTVPEGMENSYTGNTSLLWRSVAFRWQCVYDAQHLLNQNVNHPIEITRLRFRPLNGIIDAGGQVHTGVTIKLSMAVTDSQTMDVTFANNVGLDELTVFQGDVTLLPTTGTTPNDHHIDISLQTPFIYNPENGPLLVDVDAPNAPSAAVPNMAASNNFLTQFARRCSTTTVGSPTGALSGFAAAMKIDDNIPAGTAFAFEYGEGCYNKYVSFYEEFPAGTIDLGSGAAGSTNRFQAIPNSTGGYIVIPGSNQLFQPLSADLALGDDATSAALPLGFAFNYPGGSCSDVVVESNGNVWLQTPNYTGFVVSAGPQSLVSRGAVISAFYEDMDPSAATGGGSVHFDSDPTNGVAYITCLNCPLYEATPTVPRPTNTVQVAIYSSGIFELRHQQLDTSVSWTNTTVGFSPGNS
jgi:hypothetical protein